MHLTSVMFTELLQAEVWRKRLETAGYRVILEPWDAPRPTQPPPERDRRDRVSQPMQAPAAP
jgi:hypothetical protein